ncbi:MAG TPA: AEC family transporter [Methanospirillum sp.]|nr:AEC family transporter [Methanospirillum sp.]
MDLLAIVESIITLFLLIGTGYAAFRVGVINRQGVGGLSSLLVNVTLPCLIIESMQVPMTPQLLGEIGTIAQIELLVYTISFLCAFLVPLLLKGSQYETGVFRFMLIFSNLGFMGYPVCQAIFGSESLFYVTLINIPFGLLVFTVGVFLIRPDLARNPNLKQILTPGLTASLLGLLFFFIGFDIPSPFSESLILLGSVTTPLAMIVIGALLATLPVASTFGDVRIWAISLFRLMIIPGLIFLVLRPFINDPILIGVPVLLSAMPVAANTVLLAEEYGVNSEIASKGVFLSTLLSVVTIPVVGFFIWV